MILLIKRDVSMHSKHNGFLEMNDFENRDILEKNQ